MQLNMSLTVQLEDMMRISSVLISIKIAKIQIEFFKRLSGGEECLALRNVGE